MKAAFAGLVFSVAGLLALGMVMLYSSSMGMVMLHNSSRIEVGAHYLVLQMMWCGLGLLSCAVAAKLDYDLLRKYALPLFALTVGLLALVLKFGPIINNAQRWLVFHGLRFQPSELAKLALIVALAWYGAKYLTQMRKFWRGLVLPMVVVSVPLALIFKEPDRGTTALLTAVTGAILVLAGARWRFIVPPFLAGVVGFAFYLWHDPMAGKRLLAWLHPEENKAGIGYQSYEAMLALGSGGLTGLGLGNGRQKLGFVPEHHTDFIFSIIGEELGLIGTFSVVLLFVVFVLCGLYIARNARETFGTLLAFGITILIGLQAAINIGVVTSALPNKGLPLPFISYGGSSLLMMLTCVGVLLSVARRASVQEALPVPRAASDNPFAAQPT